jgi:hypothetical protein
MNNFICTCGDTSGQPCKAHMTGIDLSHITYDNTTHAIPVTYSQPECTCFFNNKFYAQPFCPIHGIKIANPTHNCQFHVQAIMDASIQTRMIDVICMSPGCGKKLTAGIAMYAIPEIPTTAQVNIRQENKNDQAKLPENKQLA